MLAAAGNKSAAQEADNHVRVRLWQQLAEIHEELSAAVAWALPGKKAGRGSGRAK